MGWWVICCELIRDFIKLRSKQKERSCGDWRDKKKWFRVFRKIKGPTIETGWNPHTKRASVDGRVRYSFHLTFMKAWIWRGQFLALVAGAKSTNKSRKENKKKNEWRTGLVWWPIYTINSVHTIIGPKLKYSGTYFIKTASF